MLNKTKDKKKKRKNKNKSSFAFISVNTARYFREVITNLAWFAIINEDIIYTFSKNLKPSCKTYFSDVSNNLKALSENASNFLSKPVNFDYFKDLGSLLSRRFNRLVRELNLKFEKQVYLFSSLRGAPLAASESAAGRSNLNLAFNPFHIYQGVFVFLLTLLILFTSAFLLSEKPKISDQNIIKTATTIQTSEAIAGRPVKWIVLVKASDITDQSYLLQLPKNAKNIKVKTIPASSMSSRGPRGEAEGNVGIQSDGTDSAKSARSGLPRPALILRSKLVLGSQ